MRRESIRELSGGGAWRLGLESVTLSFCSQPKSHGTWGVTVLIRSAVFQLAIASSIARLEPHSNVDFMWICVFLGVLVALEWLKFTLM